jgi:hypothetical protein
MHGIARSTHKVAVQFLEASAFTSLLVPSLLVAIMGA